MNSSPAASRAARIKATASIEPINTELGQRMAVEHEDDLHCGASVKATNAA
jgi:hypothetical protein